MPIITVNDIIGYACALILLLVTFFVCLYQKKKRIVDKDVYMKINDYIKKRLNYIAVYQKAPEAITASEKALEVMEDENLGKIGEMIENTKDWEEKKAQIQRIVLNSRYERGELSIDELEMMIQRVSVS